MNFTLKIWRQKDAASPGRFAKYYIVGVSPEISVPEMLDQLNEDLVRRGEEAVTFDSDCREGMCGTCGFMVNGRPHGHQHGSTVCELRMREFKDGETICMEPFRSRAFPVVKDLVIDRTALDGIIQAGGFVSVNTGSVPDANAIPITKQDAERAMISAQCIGCGACVAACPNASASLFTGAKISHFQFLPQGRVEWKRRVLMMADAMEQAGFGSCSNRGQCSASCPKEIPLDDIARFNRLYILSSLFSLRAGGKGEEHENP